MGRTNTGRMRRWAVLGAVLLALHGAGQAQSAAAPEQGFYNSGTAHARTPVETVAVGQAVVTAADQRAAEAGRAMLAAGGSAVDAALATMLALNVVEPQSSGIGGGAFLAFYDAKAGETVTLDGREKAPAAARADRFLVEGAPMPFMDAVEGGLSVGVPGTLALIAEAHRRWGTLPWKDLFAPAIRLARDGVTVGARMHAFIGSRREMLAADPAARALFLDRNGAPVAEGTRLKQPRLARTLDEIARKGPDVFYRGPIGREVSRAVAHATHHPAEMTAADLAAYRVVARPPLCRPYRIWTICTMGPPSAGGVAILQILAQLERFDLHRLGSDNLLSWHLIAESMRLAYADREAYGADSDFVAVPLAGLLDPDYLAARSRLIRIDRAMPLVTAGHPPAMPAPRPQKLADIPATTHLAAADAAGNVVSVTSTIEGPFGSGLMAAGFMLNNELTDFSFLPVQDGAPAPNRVAPGKRPMSSMAPTIVFDRAGAPIATFGAAGGATIIAQIAKTLIAFLDWGLPPGEAIAAPQIYANRNGVFYEAGTRLEGMAAGLRALGHENVRAADLPLKGNGIARQGAGLWRGAADRRSEGQAVAFGRGN